MGLFATTAARDADQKVSVIREQIKAEQAEIKDLEEKKHRMWVSIKDFGTADAIRADKGYAYMSTLHRQIVKLQQAIVADNKKIKKIERELSTDKESHSQKYDLR